MIIDKTDQVMKRVIVGVFVFFFIAESYGQSGVGIGTSTPNPNAVLDIVASSGDKGILIPRLTTSQRNAMAANLANAEVGLLVFDSELNSFFFWTGAAWSTINIVQDLQLSGNTLTITNNATATAIDLAPFAGTNTDNQTLSLTGTNLDIAGGNSVDLSVLQDGVNDADADPTNELQTINKAGNTVSLSNGGGSFTDEINDADADPTNELQDISTSGAAGNIALSGGSTLNLNVNDADASASNELQTIVKTGSTVTLSNAGGSFTDEVNDADANPTNELQTLSKAGNTVSLSNGGGSFIDEVNDADASPTNEIQDLTLVGSTLRITNNVAATDIDLSPFAGTNTDNQTLSVTGTDLTITGGNTVDLSVIQDGVNDADANPANELQTISKTGTTVTLSNGGGSFTDEVNDADASATNELQTLTKVGSTVTLSNGGGSFTDDTGTDDQRLSLAGTTLSIETGNAVDLSVLQDGVTDADADPANEFQTISKVGSTVTLSDGGGSFTDEVNDADASATNELQNLSTVNVGTNRTINITGGTGTTFSVADNDNSSTNEIQNLSLAGNTLSISGGNSVALPGSTPLFEYFNAYLATEIGGSGRLPVIFDFEVFNENGGYDRASGTYKAIVDGLYTFSGLITVRGDVIDLIDIEILVDEVVASRKRVYPTALSQGNAHSYEFYFDVFLTAGSAVRLEVSSPSSLAILAGQSATYILGRLAQQK